MPFEQRSVKKLNGELPRQRDSSLWWQCVSAVFIGVMLVGGFTFAAHGHFVAREFSVKNVELQRERERLKNEQKRLLLEREMVMSLDRLKRKALKIGLQEPTVNQISEFAKTSGNQLVSEKKKQQ